MPAPGGRHRFLCRTARLAHQAAADFLREVLAGRAISARLRRTRRQAPRHTPSDQTGHRLDARMVRTEALREKHPHRDGRRINPPLPKRSCQPERFVDTLFRKQAGEVQAFLTTGFRHRLTK
jgi:hypothetical protein